MVTHSVEPLKMQNGGSVGVLPDFDLSPGVMLPVDVARGRFGRSTVDDLWERSLGRSPRSSSILGYGRRRADPSGLTGRT
jgi:hypothetical protein